MGRRKILNDKEKTQIQTLFGENCSARYISRKINRHHSTVSKYLQNPEEYGSKLKQNGRKRLHSAYQRGKIRSAGSNKALGAKKIKEKAGVEVRTIQRVLKAEGLRYQKMNQRPKLQQQHRDARIGFAHQYHNFPFWDKVIFTDEKKWNLDGPDGLAFYWHDLRKEERWFSKRNFKGGSLMVWGGISLSGKVHLKVIEKRMNSNKFISILANHFLPGAHALFGENFILQQDNAPIHSSRETKEYLDSQNIEVLEWPSNSPDLNPIENCWGWLVRQVHKDVRQFSTVKELKEKLFLEWSKMDQDYINKLIFSMPKRLALVLEKQGQPLKY